jgi:hypothetical protein
VTHLTFQERIGEQAMFEQLKRDVLLRGRGRLAHLRGHAIVMTFFDDDGQAALPAGRGLADKLLEELERFEPPPDLKRRRPDDELPAELQPVQFTGGEILAVRLHGDPGGMFHRLMRWELLLAASDWITGTDAWQQFCQVTARKDSLGNEIVVVSCGSPTTPSNRARPADTLLARAVVERATRQTIDPTSNLARLWLHSWPEQSVYELLPGQLGATLLCGERFA